MKYLKCLYTTNYVKYYSITLKLSEGKYYVIKHYNKVYKMQRLYKFIGNITFHMKTVHI